MAQEAGGMTHLACLLPPHRKDRPMTRALAASLLSLCFLAAACNKNSEPDDIAVDRTGGRSGSSSGAGGIKSDPPASTGGSSGSGGITGSGGQTTTGSGGASASGGSTGGGSSDASADAPATSTGGSTGTTDTAAPASDTISTPAVDGGFNPASGDTLAGKAWIHLCKKDWTQAQCCEFLCQCLDNICTDSPKAKPGLATCMPTCMKLSNMLMRCHVYHCFESKNPGAVADHDSHCGHAANQVNGGGCPTAVYQ
jgi:hypothetical protein